LEELLKDIFLKNLWMGWDLGLHAIHPSGNGMIAFGSGMPIPGKADLVLAFVE
jgi:hypothetical protein